jgi:hypothetical protein
MDSIHAVKVEQDHTKDADDRKLFVKGSDSTRIHYKPENAPSFDEYQGDNDFLLNHPIPVKPLAKRSLWFRLVQAIGVIGSLGWMGVCALFFTSQGGIQTQTPYEFGIFVAGMIAPVAFFWMILSYMQRNTDARYYAETMRQEMHTLFFPSDSDSVRVNKDIELMTKQAAELASSSKAVLKTIHRARMGLRHEIKQFSGLASQAENHIIALSDAMVEKTGNLVEKTDVVHSRLNHLSEDSDKALKSWEKAGAVMVERAAEIEVTMDKGANHILSMADVAEEKSKAVSQMFDETIQSLDDTVDNASQRLGNISDIISTHTRTLEQTSCDLSKESGRLDAIVNDQVEQLNDATGRSVEAITQSVLSIQDQKDSLLSLTDDLTNKTDTINQTITHSVNKLDDTTRTVENQIESVETRLTEKSSIIANALNGFDSQIDRIDSISEIANHRLNEGIDTAINGAMQISTAIHRSIDKMDTVTNDNVEKTTQQIELLTTHINDLKKSEIDHLSQAQRLGDLMQQSESNIERATNKSEYFIQKLNETIEHHGLQLDASSSTLHEQIKLVTKSLEEPMRLVSVAVADVDGRHEQIQTTLERRINELKVASSKATESAETIRQSLREQTQDMTNLSGTLTIQTQSINAALSVSQTEFENAIQISGGAIQSLITQMSEVSDDLTFITDETSTNLMQFNNVLETSSNNLQTIASQSEKLMKTQIDSYQDQLNNLDSTLTITVENIEKHAESYKTIGAEMMPLFEQVDKRTQLSIQSLQSLDENYTVVSSTILEKIKDSTLTFDTRLENLQSGSEKASQILKSSGDYLQSCLENIQDAATSTDLKMTNIAQAIEKQSSNIHIVTDKTALRLESIQNLINEQFSQLSLSVANSVEQIEAAGSSFDIRADKISATTEDVLEQIMHAGDGAEMKTGQLKSMISDISTLSSSVTDSLSIQMTELSNNSDSALVNLRKTADSLSIKSTEIDTMMRSVLDQAQYYGKNMREQVNLIAIKSGENVATIEKSLHGLSQKMHGINDQTQSVNNFVNNATQSLVEQSKSFSSSVQQSSLAAENATLLFTKQSEQLLKASDLALKKAEHIKATEIIASRDTFMTSARFVLESLHSLSIDFIRMIDGDVSEKDWKSYRKGDISVFTSQLVSRLNDLPADKIRNKFQDDSEFRSYVQKFMGQFEDILNQTDTIDRGAILSTTFAASDVGKIYHYLSNVIGINTNRALFKTA